MFLLLKKFWCQDDLICWDLLQPKDLQYLFSVLEGKNIIRAFVTESWPCIGIDVAHHEIDLSLCIPAQIGPFRNTAPYHFMIVLAVPLLVWSVGVAVEETGPLVPLPVQFDCPGIGEFAAVIGQESREELDEDIRAELKIQPFEYINDRLGIIGWP